MCLDVARGVMCLDVARGVLGLEVARGVMCFDVARGVMCLEVIRGRTVAVVLMSVPFSDDHGLEGENPESRPKGGHWFGPPRFVSRQLTQDAGVIRRRGGQPDRRRCL